MPTTEIGAYSEMCARVKEVVDSPEMLQLVGYAPELRYGDKNYGNNTPRGDKLWCKFAIVQAGEKARTLGIRSRVTYHGAAGIQLFVPVTDGNAAERGRMVAELFIAGLQRSTPNVNFTKSGIKDMPPQSSWFYKRIFATYTFAEYQG